MNVAASSAVTSSARWRALLVSLVVLAPAPACVLDLGQKHGCRADSDCAVPRVCVAAVCAEPRGGAGTTGAAGADAAAERLDAVDAIESGDTADGAETADTSDASVDADAATDASDAGTLAERPPGYVSSGTPNYMFVTSELFVPHFSLEAADQKCNDAASAAGLPGTFRAWLSTSEVSARDRIAKARGWIRPDGAPFADRMADLSRGWIFSPPLIDERGHELAWGTDQPVATATVGEGWLNGGACADWTAGAGGLTHVGSPWGTARFWTDDGNELPCDVPMHLYCFGIDHVAPVAPRPVDGKKAFLSDGAFSIRIGVEGADNMCAAEAFMAGLKGTFRALLATTTASAASRFPGAAQRQWVRLDGIPLNGPDQDLLAGGRLAVPLNLTSRGAYLNAYVLTGIKTIDAPAESLQETCRDWTASLSGSDALPGLNGLTSFMPSWLHTPDLSGVCYRNDSHVYCLEQ